MQASSNLFGIIMLVISIALFIGGIFLLVFGIVNTAKGKKRIGMIITGGILTMIGLGFTLTSALFNVYSNRIGGAREATYAAAVPVKNIIDAAKSNDPEELAKLFAYRGYTGRALSEDNAREFFASIDGKVEKLETNGASLSVNGETHHEQYLFVMTTDRSVKYNVTVDYISKCSDEFVIGLQHILVKNEDGTVVCEFGKEPKIYRDV